MERDVSTGPEIIIPVDCLLTRLLRRLQDYSSRGMDDAKTNERAEDGGGKWKDLLKTVGSENICVGWENKLEIGTIFAPNI